MKDHAALSILAALAAAFVAAPAIASEPAAQYRIGISAEVPVLCRVSVDAALVPDGAGRVSLGTMKEFCNNPHGYQVVMEYAPIAGDAALIVDGRTIPLGKSGRVVVARSPGAAVIERKVELQLSQEGVAPALAFRIEPL